MRARATLRLALLAVAVLGAGCVGAKTGLRLPDASLDGSADGGRDAGRDAGPDAMVPCIDVPEDAGTIRLEVGTSSRLERADVLFLIDVTASMTGEIEQIRRRLRDTIAPTLTAEIPDVAFGVATFADYPTSPYGDDTDVLFALEQPMTTDLPSVQGALQAIRLGNGSDPPEGQVEALYESATGSGQSGYDGTRFVQWVAPSFGCPHGGFGYPCFRGDSLPLIFLFTDAEFHEGPGGTNPYILSGTVPHTYEEARDALHTQDIHVIGFWSGDSGTSERNIRQIAMDTGALASDGTPLVFDIGTEGASLDTRAVEAIQAFARGVTLDIDAIAVDPVPDPPDATVLVRAVVPTTAVPMTGITGIDTGTNTFRGVRPGTHVFFELELQNDAIPPGDVPKEFLLDIVFRGNGRSDLGRTRIRLVIPARDGTGCPPGPDAGVLLGP